MSVKKAIIPVAGKGTRFYPATIASPKEMLPIVNKPLIQYVVEELIDEGVTEIYFVINSQKKSIEEHFDAYFSRDLSAYIKISDQQHIQKATFSYLRQPQALGLGHAIWCARHVIGKEPFVVVLPDEFMPVTNKNNACIRQLINKYEQCGHSVIALQEVPKEDINRYGIAMLKDHGLVEHLIEKPELGTINSQCAVIGRYLLTANTMRFLEENQKYTTGNEIQLTPTLDVLANRDELTGIVYNGERFDCGQTKGFVDANIHIATLMEAMSI